MTKAISSPRVKLHIAHLLVFCVALSTFSRIAFAWGKRGHAIVCETAAYLNADRPDFQFLKADSYDLGYYCNVPDLIWKAPKTYKLESFNHFMDMEIFERELKPWQTSHAGASPFEMDRVQFNASFPSIPNSAGRSFWRIQEFEKNLGENVKELNQANLSDEARSNAQVQWLITAGGLGHYVGDLAQPLHATENYDGKLSNQVGIHHFYEETLVDELFGARGSNLEEIVQRTAREEWPSFHKKNRDKTTLQLIEALAKGSQKTLATVLKIDKQVGRKNVAKAAEAHRETLVSRLTQGALVQAELMSRHLNWKYVEGRFEPFVAEPPHVPVPTAASENSTDGKSGASKNGQPEFGAPIKTDSTPNQAPVATPH